MQKECVKAKKEVNSMYEENDLSNRHMTWWKNAWWIRVDSGPHMRTARGLASSQKRAAEQARDDDRVEETQSFAEEAEGKKWRRKERKERESKQRSANILHIVVHFPRNANATSAIATTTTTAAAAAAMRLQWQQFSITGAFKLKEVVAEDELLFFACTVARWHSCRMWS